MRNLHFVRQAVVTDTQILGFFGEYQFLSNFYMTPVTLDEVVYPSSEHAYMCQKTDDPVAQAAIIRQPSPGKAKQVGRQVPLRENWDAYRLAAMLKVLTAKFADPQLRQKLLDTGDKYLEETNNWGDRYWGVDGTGSNFLGQLLMLVRANYRLIPMPVRVPEQVDLF